MEMEVIQIEEEKEEEERQIEQSSHGMLIGTKNFFMKLFGIDREPHIKKLPNEVLAVIFSKLEHKDIQQLRLSARFLANAYKLERWRIPGPTQKVTMT
ncbi:unnamed protein product [Caenorhabditis angaria]|uniref:F-box domain-containing protein n=1 Tax=Caenorhabditis angaria TaxID=860376 RepID=A0A9P1IY12_9PELO|nr:unnamed protein product [Caenorhabditis angaria]